MVRFVVVLLALLPHIREQVLAADNATTTAAPQTTQAFQAPSITTHPSNTMSQEGQNVTLLCAVTGNPFPTVQWYKDDHLLNTLANPRLTKDPGSNSLSITGLLRNDEGSYVCNATNYISSVASNQAYLTVNYAVAILLHPRDQTKNEGESVTFRCEVEGKPNPTAFLCLKNGNPLAMEDILRLRIVIPQETSSTPHRMIVSLIIKDLKRTDEGSYFCNIGNIYGAQNLTVQLTVNATDLYIINPGANFSATAGQMAVLVCQVWGESPEIIWYRNGRSIKSTPIAISNKRKAAQVTLKNVQAVDSGKYTCMARKSVRSVSTEMTLVVNVPVKVDMDITVENMEYSPKLNNKSSEQFQNLSTTFTKEISSIFKDIKGFKEVQVLGFRNGSVEVSFRVIFEIEVSKPAETPPPDVKQNIANVAIKEIAKTNGVIGAFKFNPESISPLVPPPPPRNLTKKEVKLEQISIAWKKPEYHRSYGMTGYEVQYKEFAKDFWNDISVHGNDVIDYVINDLKQDTNYLVRVVALNKHGEGPPTGNLELKTNKKSLLEYIWDTYKWLIVAVAIALFILLVTGYCLCCRKRGKIRKGQDSFPERTYDDFMLVDRSGNNKRLDVLSNSRFREIPRDQITIGEKLGSGQFGLVTRGYLKQDEKHVAIKMLKGNASDDDYRDLMIELDIMSSVEEHPNIINLIGACTQEGNLYVIVELAEYGSLLDFLRDNQGHSMQYKDKVCTLSEATKLGFGLDVARGIEHLARHRCVHRDLAARNVLLGTNMTAKLSDFGLARDIYERGYYQQLSKMKKLPAKWMSVEAIETLVATKESDIWSFGVLLWEIYTGGKTPFPGLSVKELLKALKEGTRLNQPIGCSDQMYAVMISCWNSNPQKRSTIEHLITTLNEQLSTLASVDKIDPHTSEA